MGRWSAGKIFATILLHFVIPCSEKVAFSPKDPFLRGEGWGMGVCRHNVCYHVAAYVILFKFDMQHDHVLKKLNFNILPQSSTGSLEDRLVCWQKSWYHGAAFHDSIQFDMQHDHVLKKVNFDILPQSSPGS